jgi:hypothetical protein
MQVDVNILDFSDVTSQIHYPAALAPGKEPRIHRIRARWAPKAGLDDME